jgi:hypothetical protein
MPLGWTRADDFGILTVTGQGDISRRDIEDYLSATVREGTKSNAKLVDITAGTLTLDRDDLEAVARLLLQYGSHGTAGPVAMVVHGALNIDMAVLLKQRVGQRPFRIFTNPLEARGWLMTFRPGAARPASVTPMAQPARAAK